MSNKWDSERSEETTEDVRVVLFVSRNKDNKDIPGFKERRVSFITSCKPEELLNDFKFFVSLGATNEMCRFYMSVNTRDLNKVKKDFLIKLINSDTSKELLHSESYLASIAAKSENAVTKHWLFDIDATNPTIVNMVRNSISLFSEIVGEAVTPNGYHIVTEHGFDTREFLETYPWVEIKRDGMALINWQRKY